MNRIETLRKKHKLSQLPLAELLEIPLAALRRMEIGRVVVPCFVGLRLCSALKADLAAFFPDAHEYLKSKKTVDDLIKLMGDEKAEKELEKAGLDPDPCGWYLKFVLRNGQTAVFVASSFDKNRLAHNLLNNGAPFLCFLPQIVKSL